MKSEPRYVTAYNEVQAYLKKNPESSKDAALKALGYSSSQYYQGLKYAKGEPIKTYSYPKKKRKVLPKVLDVVAPPAQKLVVVFCDVTNLSSVIGSRPQ